MSNTEFQFLVEQHFHFLQERYGFARLVFDDFSTRFEGERVVIVVVYDATRSHELGVLISLRAGIAHAVERPFEIHEWLKTIGPFSGFDAKRWEYVRHEDANAAIQQIAVLLESFGSNVLSGDTATFDQLDRQRDMNCQQLADETSLRYARNLVAKAWLRSDYTAVVTAFSPLEKELTDSERMKLEIARKRTSLE